jgi:hypothetical protein
MRNVREGQLIHRNGQNRKASFYTDISPSSDPEKDALTAEKLVELLEKHGTKVTKSEAEIILEFMSRWAKILLTPYFEK